MRGTNTIPRLAVNEKYMLKKSAGQLVITQGW